ncbi:scavenger receptor class A member 5 isoform X2 [Serinus canaria]|uniref:scavenger receptor class A member 5 isoform X2 n=1 Tax=Serinus canaria TaxID=9135 RepID=UPI0021CD0AF9|nr:scavenger receptor class A member 5 isoform X2 [Serinus canaria]
MENKAVDLHTFSEWENGSVLEEPFEGRSLSKMNLCEDDPGRRRGPSGRCLRLGSVAALKYSVVGLYLLVLLILVGIFILAVSRPRASPEELKALLGNIQRLNETFRDLQLQLLQPLPRPDLLEHIWRLQDLLQNHSDSLFLLSGSLQRLQGLLWSLQSQAGQTERSLSRLRDSLGQQSDAAQLELSRLSVEANGSRLLLDHHQHLLGHLGGRLEALGEQVAALGGAVDSMNRSFSYDVRLQHSRLRDLQGLLGNASAEARRMRAAHGAMERQLRLELALLNNVTEELRFKDWEHSVALRNISVIRAAEPEGMDAVEIQEIHPTGIPTLIPGGPWLPIPGFGMLGSPCPDCFAISPLLGSLFSLPIHGNDVTCSGMKPPRVGPVTEPWNRVIPKQTPSQGPAPDLSALTHSWHPKLPSPPSPWIIPGASCPAGFIPAPDVLG